MRLGFIRCSNYTVAEGPISALIEITIQAYICKDRLGLYKRGGAEMITNSRGGGAAGNFVTLFLTFLSL